MYITISLDATGNVSISYEEPEKIIRKKGRSILEFVDDFVVLDIETTGYSQFSDIIEIGALIVKNGEIADTFQSLVKPSDFEERIAEDGFYLDDFIVKLTGITDNMLTIAPNIKDVLQLFLDFTGDGVIVAHNANFDINFLYDAINYWFQKEFNNNFIDTLRVSRRVFKEYDKHKLSYLARELKLQHMPSHRALSDCYVTLSLYYACKEKVNLEKIDISKKAHNLKAKNIIPENPEWFAEDHPLYDKNCVFTGTLSRMTRKEAMQMVVNIGGKCSDSINKKTNYLIIGIQDYSKFTDGMESNKTKKAKKLIDKGLPIKIISEDDFCERMFNIDLGSR